MLVTNWTEQGLIAAIHSLCYIIGNTGLQPGGLGEIRTRLIHNLGNPLMDNGELMVLHAVSMHHLSI